MRYFVTGGAGFIGLNYIEYLIQQVKGVTFITVYDNFTYAANSHIYEKYEYDPRVRVVKGNICHFEHLTESMKNHDFVIHFAAETHVDRSIDNASVFIQTNVLGTFNILEASRKNHIRTFIHVSTDEVYGSLKEGFADESFPLAPNSPYASSKAASDLLVRSYFMTYGLDVRTTRSCNNYGKYQFPEKVIPVFILNALVRRNLPIYGDGKNVREWIHVADHIRGIQTVLMRGKPGEIYNIGSGFYLTNNQLADKILTLTDADRNLKTFVQDRKGHDFRYAMSSKKIQSLGFNSSNNFDLKLKETIEWYAQNRK